MARVRMQTLSAGPKGVREPGSIVTVPDDEALDLVEARAAVLLPDVEAAVKGPRETAMRPRARGR